MTYRKSNGSDTWHFCYNCSLWPGSDYDQQQEPPKIGALCNECRSLRRAGTCQDGPPAPKPPAESRAS